MRLAEYLEAKKITRSSFAREIGVTAGWITSLCDGSGWPSREVAERISKATEGAVKADDFLTQNSSHSEQSSVRAQA